MPYSYPMYKDLVAKHIRAKLRAFDNVLDVGCGCGTYAQLLSGIEMDGCEIYEPYVERFGLHNLYRNLFIADIRTFDVTPYTYLIMGDVFEHLTAEEGRQLLNRIEGKHVMIAVPFLYEQGEWEGNVYETHHQPDLTPAIMQERYPELNLLIGDNAYGYYVNYLL